MCLKVELINKIASAEYFLYDISGKLVEKGHIDNKKQFSGFLKGVYVLVDILPQHFFIIFEQKTEIDD